MINVEMMKRYLVRETRYTMEELNKLSEKTIVRFYKEERVINKL